MASREPDGLYNLAGKAVLVTGAGAGIGRATALAFHKVGASVLVSDLDEAAARSVAEGIEAAGGRALAAELDVTDEARVDAVMARAEAHFGTVDVLVNNAGIGARVPTVDLPTESWRRALDIGLDGTFYCSRAAGRIMTKQRRGAVVNVASVMGLCGGGLYPNAAYHAAKGAVVNLTRALALEWAPANVRVNAVAPAFVRTRLVEPLLSDEAMRAAILASTPLGRIVEPEEVAAAIVFLASDAASMITGHTLPVDGGWMAR